MNATVVSALLGAVLALGLWLVLVATRAVGAPSFAERIAPQLRAAELASGLGDPVWSSRRARGTSLAGAFG
ncbi:pilus assembly protein TadB, partial [Kocuria sp. HSID17582]